MPLKMTKDRSFRELHVLLLLGLSSLTDFQIKKLKLTKTKTGFHGPKSTFESRQKTKSREIEKQRGGGEKEQGYHGGVRLRHGGLPMASGKEEGMSPATASVESDRSDLRGDVHSAEKHGYHAGARLRHRDLPMASGKEEGMSPATASAESNWSDLRGDVHSAESE
ncbi:hypothetical protein U1Q18_016077 [Sarracenia purpurea var. burkii]